VEVLPSSHSDEEQDMVQPKKHLGRKAFERGRRKEDDISRSRLKRLLNPFYNWGGEIPTQEAELELVEPILGHKKLSLARIVKYGCTWGARPLENLAYLRGILRKGVDRPWAETHSRIVQLCTGKGCIGKHHIMVDHLPWEVELHAGWSKGSPTDSRGLTLRSGQLYVDDAGYLRQTPAYCWQRQLKRVIETETAIFAKLETQEGWQWYEVERTPAYKQLAIGDRIFSARVRLPAPKGVYLLWKESYLLPVRPLSKQKINDLLAEQVNK